MAEVRRDLALLARAGVRALRVSVGWDGVEPAHGRAAIVAWVPTAASGRSIEHVSVGLTGLTAVGSASWWDAQGHARAAPLGTAMISGTNPELDGVELRGDDVVVVEIPLAL